jgi:nucleoside 2-deoxyribosyltransferase
VEQKVYLAGPEVFAHNAPSLFVEAKKCAVKLGLIPLSPLDAVASSHIKNDKETAELIYKGNIGLINEADVVVANLNEFRGTEPDSGTVFEVGYAVAMGKRVIAYVSKNSVYRERVARQKCLSQDAQGRWYDEQEQWVEEMGLPFNLMLSCSVEWVVGGIGEALLLAAKE